MGFYQDAGPGFHGFLLGGGSYTPLDVPGVTNNTTAFGINGVGRNLRRSFPLPLKSVNVPLTCWTLSACSGGTVSSKPDAIGAAAFAFRAALPDSSSSGAVPSGSQPGRQRPGKILPVRAANACGRAGLARLALKFARTRNQVGQTRVFKFAKVPACLVLKLSLERAFSGACLKTGTFA